MSGSIFFPTVGRDQMVKILQDRISYFRLGEGGFVLSGETTEVIDGSASGSDDTYDYTISGGDFAIILVNQGTNYFEISGTYASFFPDYARISVSGSTGNDDNYTVSVGGVSEVGGNTRIKVDEAIPSSVADGILYVDHRPIAPGPTSDAKHWPLVVEEVTPGLVQVQSVSDTTGTGGLTGDGTGTINYKSGDLNVEFDSDVTAGNIVRVRFKYHDRRLDASGGASYTDLESSVKFGVKGVNTVTKKFQIDGEHASKFTGTPKIQISGSTANDDDYTFVAAVEAGGDTYIEVSEVIPDATADGLLQAVSADGESPYYTYQKAFGADGDTYIEFRGESLATIRCHMRLQLNEGIDDGRGTTYGGTPFYFEGGVFDDEDVMLAYFTFDKERKTGSIQLEHTADFVI